MITEPELHNILCNLLFEWAIFEIDDVVLAR